MMKSKLSTVLLATTLAACSMKGYEQNEAFDQDQLQPKQVVVSAGIAKGIQKRYLDWENNQVELRQSLAGRPISFREIINNLCNSNSINCIFQADLEPHLAVEPYPTISFVGKLLDAFEYLANAMDVGIHFDKDSVTWVTHPLRVYELPYFAGIDEDTEQSSNIQTTWEKIKQDADAILGDDGIAIVDAKSGSLTIKSKPYLHKQIEALVAKLNEVGRRQVRVDAIVVQYETQRRFGFGFNLTSLMYGRNNTSTDTKSVSTLAQNNAFDAGVEQSYASLNYNKTNLSLQALFNLLSSNGKVEVISKPSITVQTGNVGRLSITREKSYLARTEAVSALSGNGQQVRVGLIPDIVTDGLSFNVMPHALKDGSVNLEFSLELSVLRSISTVSSGDQTIQTPEKTSRQVSQKLNINSGEKLIVSGLEELSVEKSTTKDILGFSKASQNSNSQTLIILSVQQI